MSPIERSAGGGTSAPAIGSTSLIYRYTVAGVDKVSIDTGVDAAQAGTSDWTNGDLLEVFLYGRTDEVITNSVCLLTVNNDGGANYDRAFMATSAGGSPIQGTAIAATSWSFSLSGTLAIAGSPSGGMFAFPDYMSATFWKLGTQVTGNAQSAVGGEFQILNQSLVYRSTSAISRLKLTPSTGGQKLKVGTQILVYKRLAS